MEQVTQFPVGATHVLTKFENKNGTYYSYRLINQNGFNIYTTVLGREVVRIPDISANDPDGYWPVVGYYSESDVKIIKKGLIEKDTREGKNILRNYKVDEQVVRIEA